MICYGEIYISKIKMDLYKKNIPKKSLKCVKIYLTNIFDKSQQFRLSDLFESLAATASERLQKLSDDHDEYVEKFHSELVNLVEKTRQIVWWRF